MFLPILLLVVICGLLYFYYKRTISYWDRQGLQNIKPKSPLNIFGIGKNKPLLEFACEIYNSLDLRYFGAYFVTPVLVIKDINLLKKVTIKDFDSFTDHRTFIPEGVDPLWNGNLFQATGNRWKQLRPTLSPNFTSSKMRTMFLLMQESADQFTNFFLEQKKDIIKVELRDIFSRYTNDAIATTAFGLKIDSLKEPDNSFYRMGKEGTNFRGFYRFIKTLLFAALNPTFMKMIGMKVSSNEVYSYFNSIIKNTIKSREKNKIVRPDLIHLLMETRKGKKTEEDIHEIKELASVDEYNLDYKTKQEKLALTDDDILTQAYLFFLAGFDGVSILMCFIAYELAVNPNIQERLYQEIEETYKECNGKVTYEALLQMKYLDMIVAETLRKWPPSPFTDRCATKDYVIEAESPSEKPFKIKKGMNIMVPIAGFHYDPEYFPNPNTFDPERFSEENKNTLNLNAYLPFGVGPRNCIGTRFALLENKLLIFNLLHKFKIVPIAESQIPVKLMVSSFGPCAENGFHFGFERRK